MPEYKILIPGLQFLEADGQRTTGNTVELDKRLGERLTLRGIILPTEEGETPKPTLPPPAPPSTASSAVPDITDLKPNEAIKLIQDQIELEVLQSMLAAETADKNRITVKNAIASQMEELQ